MTPKPIKILQASAGSGKTFSLVVHYLTLLFSSENKYREILAVTFTNKATAEMKERILEVLEALAKGDGNKKTENYRIKILADHPNLTAESLKQKADKIYRKILHDYSRFAISTIDSFVQKVIRCFAFELGLNADYTLEMNYDKVKNELVQKLDNSLSHNKQLLQWIIDLALERINDNKSWNYKKELYSLINEVFEGNYEVFETAVNALKQDSLDDLFVRYMSITKKEINRFEEKFKLKGKLAEEIFQKHEIDMACLKRGKTSWLCKLAIIQNLDYERIDKIFRLIDNPKLWFKDGKELTDFYDELNPILKKLRKFQSENIANYSLAVAFNKNLYYLRLMQEIVLLLSDYRKENGNLLISDAQKLITGITDDAEDNPSFIWEKVGNKYRNFLFDEFQDTSVNQWKSFRSVLSNAIASPGQHFTDHLIVGDAKQSIYRWRNGDWNILHQQVQQEIGGDYVFNDYLEENYRSATNIIAFNNYLYQALPVIVQSQLNAKATQKTDDLLQWWNAKGYHNIVTSVYGKAKQKPASSAKTGGTIKVKCFDKEDATEKVEMFSETVFRQLALDDVIQEITVLRSQKRYRAKDIAILVRSNLEVMLSVNRLMEANIPVLSGQVLLIANNSAVRLLVNTLKVFVGIESQTALYKANCIVLYHRLNNKPLHSSAYLNLTRQSLSNLSALLPLSLCENWQTWLQLPLIELVEKLISAYGLDRLTQHIPYLLAFRDLLDNASPMGEKGIVNFLTWWAEEGVKKALPSPDEADAVQVITIHKSKGLAFGAVFIPFCSWELKTKNNSVFWAPSGETIYKELASIPLKFNDNLADSAVAKAYFKELLDSSLEALNLLYVATTRAKDYLYLSVMRKSESNKTTSSVGDALVQAIGQLTSPESDKDFNKTNRYEITDDLIPESNEEPKPPFKMNIYPTTNRLSALYVPPQESHLRHLLNMEEFGRVGSIKHEVLANATNENQVHEYLNKMLLEGTIAEEEMEIFENEVMEVLNHPELKSILSQAKQSVTEKDIIDADGNFHRPDRILINENQVTILDYKFTSEQSDKHIEQILNYKKLFTEMGYVNVKGYLFYAFTQQLKLVG